MNARVVRCAFGFLFVLFVATSGAAAPSNRVLVESNSVWRFVKGTQEASNPSNAWRLPDYDDSGWSNAPAPFFFGDPYNSVENPGTLLSDMQGTYTSVYFRSSFYVPDPAALTSLVLRYQSDDGFIAWINGVEVLRYNMPAGNISFNGTASSNVNEPQNRGPAYFDAFLGNFGTFLIQGTNTVAVHAFNSSLNLSSDFGFNAQIYGSLGRPVITAAPASQTVRAETTVNFAVQADGAPPLSYQWRLDGTNLPGASNDVFTITDAQPQHSGNYTVVIANTYGSVTSVVAQLIVAPVLHITRNGGQLTLSWNGSGFELEQSTDLVNWTVVGASSPYTITGHFTPRGFFRLGGGPEPGPIYSANVVGYVNVSLRPGWNAIANPLQFSISNFLYAVLPSVPNEAELWKIGPNGLECSYFYEEFGGWFDCDPEPMTLSPGEGAMLYAPAPGTITWIGEVQQGSVLNKVPAGLALASSIVPQDRPLTGNFGLGFPAISGDTIYRFNPSNQSYVAHTYLGNDNWEPYEPLASVGEPFWTELGEAHDWGNAFSAFFTGGSGPAYVVTNWALNGTNAPFPLPGKVPPAIVSQPVSQTNGVGTNVSFSVTATGSPPLRYQWFFGNTAMAGQTNSTLTLLNIQTANAGGYSAIVSNAFGRATSVVATLTVTEPLVPSVLRIAVSGDQAQLWWDAPAGYGFIVEYKNALCDSYWMPLGAPVVSSGTTLSVTLPIGAEPSRFFRVAADSEAVYSSNVVGYVNVSLTSGANLISNPFMVPPSNSVQDLIPYLPDTCDTFCPEILKVGAAQFFPGFDCAFYDFFWWDCDDFSQSMTLSPGEGAILLLEEPFNISFAGDVLQGSLTNKLPAGLSLCSSIVPCGGGIMSHLGFPAEPGDTIYKLDGPSQSYVPHTFLGDGNWSPFEPAFYAGESFWAELSNARDWVRHFSADGGGGSGGCTVTNRAYAGPREFPAPPPKEPMEPPAILVQPQSRTNTVGTDATFSVVASGTEPLSYQWQFNGANLPGATGTNLVLLDVQFANAGNYRVVVSSPWGSVTSPPALLAVSNYCVEVDALSATNVMGSNVIFQVRSFDCLSGNAVSNAPAVIWIRTAGTVRSIPVTTDSSGQAMIPFQPLQRETGSYGYSASLPGFDPPPPTGGFMLVGMDFTESEATHRLRVGVPITNRIEVRNLTTAALSGLGAFVSGAAAHLHVEVSVPQTLEGSATNELTYTVTALSETPASDQFSIHLTSAEGASANFAVNVDIAPPRPKLVANPASLRRSMLRGDQTLVEVELANIGGAPASDILVWLPPAPWLALVSTQRIASLGMDETNTVTLALTPPADLPLQPYESHILFNAVETDLTVPFVFDCVSALQANLHVAVVDEATYLAEGAPKVTNASVTVTRTGANVASGITDATGTILFTNLVEGFYDINVSADKHHDFNATLLVAAHDANEVVAYVPQKGFTYTWEVAPTEDPDHYSIQLKVDFETTVPWPNLTIEPAGLDLCNYGVGTNQVMLTISNHSLINAESLELVFPSHPAWKITQLVSTLPDLGPRSEAKVPVLIERTASNGNVPSRMDGRLDYEFRGDNIIFHRSAPIVVWNANAWDCTNAPLVTLEPRELDLCSLAPGTNWANFTIRNRAALPIDELNLAFESHVHWRIEPSATNLGSLGAHTNLVVPVQLIKTPSPVSGPNRIKGRLAFRATLENETRSFSRATILHNPNPWDCVASPLVTIRPSNVDLCDFTAQMNWVTFTVTNRSEIDAHDVKLVFGTHPRWQIQPSVTDVGTLPRGTQLVISVLFQKVSTLNVGPRSIGAHLDYQATVDGETRLFSSGIGVNNANPWDCLPNPPVTIWPDYLNLCSFRSKTNRVDFAIHNRSSVAAHEATLRFGTHPRWQIQPLTNTDFGTLPPHTSFTVPVLFIETNRTNQGSSYIGARFDYYATADGQRCDFSPLISIYNANLSDCIAPPIWPPGTNTLHHRDLYRYLFVRGTLQFEQLITVMRNTFTATLNLFNGSESELTFLGVDFEILDMAQDPATNRFGIRLASSEGLGQDGVIETNASARISWTLIPATNAAPTGPTDYIVGGELRHVFDGATSSVPLYPVLITVYPDPRLRLDYFWERIAFSDDAMTGQIEPTVPFAVGLIMRNEGLGTARKIQIETAKPKIVDNESGLIIAFNLVGAQVGNQPFLPDLTLGLGDLAPGNTVEALWWLTSSLQADFVEYRATFTHLDDLGQTNLSLIDSVAIHPLVHVVRDDRPEADTLPDFLVMDVTNAARLPDNLYLSDGSVISNVTSITDATVDGHASRSHSNVVLTISPPLPTGWTYLRIQDPSEGSRLMYVERSDGRRLLCDNFWTTHRIVYPRDGNPAYREDFLHLFDYDVTETYTLRYNVDLYITRQPQSLLCVTAGTAAPFRVQVGGVGPFAYQWYKWGTNLMAGETNATLTIGNVQTNDAGYYSVRISNAAAGDDVWSDPATLTVCVPPTITDPPQCRTNIVGQTATFTVAATGTMPLSYQWFKGDTALSGEANTTFSIPNLQTNHAGEYRVKIHNVAGTNSASVCLFVFEPPCLEAVSNQTNSVGRQLVITNRACDTNLSLTFTLCGGPGTITPEGVFRWTPSCNQGSSTYLICVRAIDNANPILSNSVVFSVRVPECIQAGLGNTVMLAGTTSSVPVRLVSSTELTNMSFTVGYPTNRFDTNFALAVNSPHVITQQWSLIEPGQIKLSFTLPATNILYGPTNVGSLSFSAVPDQSSDFVWLLIGNVTGLKPDGSEVANAYGNPGRVVVIGKEPLLEPWLNPARERMLTTYGRPNTIYEILHTNQLVCAISSSPTNWVLDASLWPVGWTNTVPPALFYTEPLPAAFSNAPTLFLRAKEK